jgi:hypothetical protein
MPPTQTFAYNLPSRGRKRRVVVGVLIFILLLGGGAAAYFGYLLPRNPEYALQKALQNTAAGYDRLVTYADEQKDVKGFKVDGSFKLEGIVAADGTFDFTSYQNQGQGKFDIGAAGVRFGLETRLLVQGSSTSPDIYVKATGFKGLESIFGSAMTPSANQMVTGLDNQWIVIDHTAFDQLKSMVTEAGAPSLSHDDMIAIARVVGRVNKDHLWTTSSDKAVFTLAQKLGTEDKDGHKSHHYKIGYNKTHLKTYLTTLKNELGKTKLAELAPDKDVGKLLEFDELIKSVDKLKGTSTAEVWVDAKAKLVRAVRFNDQKKAGDFVEIGLNYNGGDDYPFFLSQKLTDRGTTEGKVTLTLNPKANTLKFDLKAEFKPEQSPKTVLTATAKTAVNNQPVNVEKPEGAKSWLDILGGASWFSNPEAPVRLPGPEEIEI